MRMTQIAPQALVILVIASDKTWRRFLVEFPVEGQN